MKNRRNRLEIIIDVIKQNVISNQDELLRQLAMRGILVTQATLSRDLKKLNILKVSTDIGGYRYVLAAEGRKPGVPFSKSRSTHQALHHPAAISLRFSCHLAIIKTRVGFAGGLAYDIDMLRSEHILGTIPGSDTVLAVCNDKSSREEILELMRRILPASVVDEAVSSL